MDQKTSSLVALYVAKRTDLVRFFTARTGSAAEADDIVQDMYLKLANVAPDGVVDEIAYLYRLGVNVMLDRVRSRQRRSARETSYYQAFQTGAPGSDAADAPEPGAALDAKRRLGELAIAIEALPKQCRTVFVMHKLEGRSHSEIAKTLGVSRSAVEKHMITALKRLTAFPR